MQLNSHCSQNEQTVNQYNFARSNFSIENIFPTVYVLFYITHLNLNPDSYRGSLSLLEVNVERKYFIELKKEKSYYGKESFS